jgi:Tol biopolymer transport system component
MRSRESQQFDDWGPVWSPDGSRIAFTRDLHSPLRAVSYLYVLDLATGRLHRISPPFFVQVEQTTWSPDGRRLAYLGPPAKHSPCPIALHVTNADGTGDQVLAAASRTLGAPSRCSLVWTPSWSPDGHWLAFGRSTHEFGSGPGGIDLYLISPDGSKLHRLTHEPDLVHINPTWSADGKRIAFGFSQDDDPGITLAVMNRDGSHRHTIRLRGQMYGYNPDWQHL